MGKPNLCSPSERVYGVTGRKLYFTGKHVGNIMLKGQAKTGECL